GAWRDWSEEAIGGMARALGETRIQGVATNLEFLGNVISHHTFASGAYTTRFVDETPELVETAPEADGLTGLLEFLGDVIVNGNAEMRGRPRAAGALPAARVPDHDQDAPIPPGSRDRLLELGPERVLAEGGRGGRVR